MRENIRRSTSPNALAAALPVNTISRLKAAWQGEMERRQRPELLARRYFYFWVDGIYFSPRMDNGKQCILAIIGTELAIEDGDCESARSWREMFLELKKSCA